MRVAKTVEVTVEELNGHEATVTPVGFSVKIPTSHYGMIGKGIVAVHKKTGDILKLCIPSSRAASPGEKVAVNPGLLYWSNNGMFAGVARLER